MHRFYADGLGEIGSLVTLSEEDARHASRVLRMQPGDAAELFLDGRRFSAEIAEMTAEGVTARLISELPSTEATLRITLYQGLPKAEKMELIVQKAVELGAARVVPVAMSRCVVQLSAKDGAKKQERWQKIAREACKQSGRCQMMAVDAPIAFPARGDRCPGRPALPRPAGGAENARSRHRPVGGRARVQPDRLPPGASEYSRPRNCHRP